MLIEILLKYLDLECIGRMSLLSKYWKDIINSDKMYQKMHLKLFGVVESRTVMLCLFF